MLDMILAGNIQSANGSRPEIAVRQAYVATPTLVLTQEAPSVGQGRN